VSRPWSALNRLGSYVRWEQKYFEGQDEYRLKAEEGYIWNDQSKALTMISSEKGVNVPLQKTLNYLSKVNLKKDLNDVIISENSNQALLGFADGTA
jgi:hypothetical protein